MPQKILKHVILTTILASVALAAIITAGAEAKKRAMLYTPPIRNAGTFNQVISCTAVNTDTEGREITIEIFAEDGSLVERRDPQVVEPLHVVVLERDVSTPVNYCRVSVDGSASTVRAGLCLLDSTTGGCTTPPVPAQ